MAKLILRLRSGVVHLDFLKLAQGSTRYIHFPDTVEPQVVLAHARREHSNRFPTPMLRVRERSIGRWMYGWMYGWMDRWIDGWMDR